MQMVLAIYQATGACGILLRHLETWGAFLWGDPDPDQ